MKIKLEPAKKKAKCVSKTLYLPNEVIDKLEQLAIDNETSFSKIVVSMVEFCLEDEDAE